MRDVEQIFPKWKTARPLLRRYVQGLGEWVVTADKSGAVNVGLVQPTIKDEVSGEQVFMWASFPEEDRPLVMDICLEVQRRYLPDMMRFLERPVTSVVLAEFRAAIEYNEREIIAMGGDSVRVATAKALGVYDFGLDWSLK